ncbi:general transcription factor 3C polypeptide 6 isoform X1 [Protobothrops mucrosquamatus]|uniref:general transcription factor 3C polypeptide 6 isoform X1 n=1 Tax=Protobothrops mucrosquamatus TaxID=103944 RepID=UPI000775695D|nr:general transcription factor 3C polypeptide 6 isoform X1 [Protobothrops mucrosquamatus]
MAAGASRETGGGPGSMEAAGGAQEAEEVEEQLVVVELSGIIDSDFLEKCDNKCKILGIDTERPILQIDRYIFAGEYEDTLGTCVVFEENHEHVDVEGNQKLQLKYKCHTMKKLNMTRTLLIEKKEGEENIGGGIEWLDLRDKDFSYSRPNTICNFLHEKDDETAESQDKLAEESEEEASDKGNADCNLEPGIPLDIAKDDAEPHLDTPDPIIENPSIENSQNIASEEPLL